MAQVEILGQLVETPRIRLSEIAFRHRLAVNTVSTLVKELALKGYVVRTRDPRDGRAQLLEASPAGVEALESWITINETFMRTAFSRLDDVTVETLRASLPALFTLAAALEGSYDDTF